MSRSERLLDLIQALRRHRRPVSGKALADELGVSIRTLYRDIATLQGQGAGIEGEPGLGYVLKPGFFLPPLMFGADEVDAVILGLRFVSQRGDDELARAAANVLAKIAAVLPPELEDSAATSGLLAGPRRIGKGVASCRHPPGDPQRGEAAARLFGQEGQGIASAWCGRSPSASSKPRRCLPHGARRGGISGISGWIASPGWRRFTSERRSGIASCSPNGGCRRISTGCC